MIFVARWQRRASWLSVAWSGCTVQTNTQRMKARRRPRTARWIQPLQQPGRAFLNSAWPCWTRACPSSNATGPCLLCVTMAVRRLCWPWEQVSWAVPVCSLWYDHVSLPVCSGLQCSSALFRHEIAYVLGQMQHPAAVSSLCEALECSTENPMVRHEAAEALGSIGKQECLSVLQRYRSDREPVVKESCEVALDMLEYENSDQFQYADGLARLQG